MIKGTKTKIVVLTGAGISAESGISTFRDANGLWENHDIMDVASWHGWVKNPALVLDFYNQRRRQLKQVQPNSAHAYLKMLEDHFDVVVVTQNVDNLHERAGSSKVIHLHGLLNQVRSENNENLVYPWTEDLHQGDTGEDGAQLRPDIVWFGEMVPKMEDAILEASSADILLVIGTSLQVYPAASLIEFVPATCPVYVIDPKAESVASRSDAILIRKKATEGVLDLHF